MKTVKLFSLRPIDYIYEDRLIDTFDVLSASECLRYTV